MIYPTFQRFIPLLGFLIFSSTHLSAQPDSLKAEGFYQKGKDLYYGGQYEKALRQFSKAFTIHKGLYGEESKPVLKTLYRMGSAARYLRNHPLALDCYEQGLEIAQKLSGDNSEDAADFYYGLGATYSQMYDPVKAKSYYEKCLAIYKQLFGPESSEAGNMYMNIGSSFHKMANYHDAEQYYKKAFTIFQQSSDPESQDFNRIYSNMGYLYRKVGDYDRAIDFGKKALEIKLKHYKRDHPSVAKYHRNIGRALQEKGAFEEALPYLQKAVEIQEKTIGKKHPNTGGGYGEMGTLYADMGAYAKALKYYKKAEKILEASLEPTHPYLVGGYFNFGTVYEDMGDMDKAIFQYNVALSKFKSRGYAPQNLIAETQRRIAHASFKNGQIDSAILLIQKSFSGIVPAFQFDQQDFYTNPPIQKAQDKLGFLKLLDTKARFLEGRFKKQSNQKDLQEGFKTIELAIEVVEDLRKSYQSEEARQFLNSETSPIYEKAVQLAYDLFEQSKDEEYLFKAFEISEKSKASILWQNLNENLALQSASIPSEDLNFLDQVASRITGLEEALYESKNNQPVAESLKSEIFDLKLQYQDRIALLEKQNPRYFQMKYQAPEFTLAQLIDHIPDATTAILEYFYDEQYLYCFSLSKEGLSGNRIVLETPFQENIKAIRKVNIGLLSSQQNHEDFLSRVFALYEQLIEPVYPSIKEKESLIIIPHALLQHLSFEMLAPKSKERDFRKLPYLIHRFTLQYAWSAAIWLESQPITSKQKIEFLGFAPEYDQSGSEAQSGFMASRAQWSALTYTTSEIEQANHYFSGQLFQGQEATEHQFRQKAPAARIIHLAGHAFTNDIQPLKSGLAFSYPADTVEDGFLNAYEIYNLKLAADMAVLSACNTGYGQLVKGEGVMSLGRAFSYAGCKSTVMSLWLANDQTTSALIVEFYENLANGLSKDEALRNAKLNYLQKADPLTAHPYFWAGLIAVGEMSPLTSDQDTLPFYFSAFVVVLIGLFILIRTKTKVS